MAGAPAPKLQAAARLAPAASRRLRPAKLYTLSTIMAFPKGDGVVIYDYVGRRALKTNTDTLYWLSYFHAGASLDQARRDHRHMNALSLHSELSALRDCGLLVDRTAPPAQWHGDYEEQWKMGPAAAMLHFATQNMVFKSLEENERLRRAKHADTPSPPLYWQDLGAPVHVAPNAVSPASPALALMAARRTNRIVKDEPVTAQAILDCLLAGQGITGFVDSGTGLLPLTMTPSGGARNPFEAFVMARNVSGLEPGFYHYEAVNHHLSRLPCGKLPSGSSLIGGQDWADPMPAIIFLVAIIERTTWKYEEPNAYRVMLVEAGHIGQNMLLAATAHGLTGVPTAAISQDNIRAALGITKFSHAPVYTVSLGVPGQYDTAIIPNAAVRTLLEAPAA